MMHSRNEQNQSWFSKKHIQDGILIILIVLAIVSLVIAIVMTVHIKEYKENVIIGQECYQQNDYEKAQMHFLRASELYSSKSEPYEWLVKIYNDQGLYNKAYSAYCRAYEQISNPSVVCGALADNISRYMYEDVLNEYKNALQNADAIRENGAEAYYDTCQFSSDELFTSICNEEGLVVAYTIEDIDKDGECELLIADITDENNPFFYCAFEQYEGECVPIFSNEEYYFVGSCYLTAYEDGGFCVTKSFDDDKTEYYYYMPKNGEMSCVESESISNIKYENEDIATFKWNIIGEIEANGDDSDSWQEDDSTDETTTDSLEQLEDEYIGTWQCCGRRSEGNTLGLGGVGKFYILEDNIAKYEILSESSSDVYVETGTWEIDENDNLIVTTSSFDVFMFFDEGGYLLADFSGEQPDTEEGCLVFEKK